MNTPPSPSPLLRHLRTRLLPAALLLAVLFASLLVKPALAQDGKIVVVLFWGDGCPHCAEEKPWLAELAQKNPLIEIKEYEVWYNEDNQKLLEEAAKKYDFEPSGVPVTLIGDQHWIGFRKGDVSGQMEEAIQACALKGGCPDPLTAASTQTDIIASNTVLDLPVIGKVDLSQQSLLVSTVLIGFVDGFNPCSLWVLSMLMALVVHTGSRRKILTIGILFLTITAGVYALFIAGVFTVLSYISFIGWIQAVVALVCAVFAFINIKDYFWYKEGVSLTIADKEKPGIYQRMRNVLNASNSFWGLIGATIVLSAGTSLVEFSCTAGFPVLWANLLTAQKVDGLTFAGLLLVYLIIYQIDELAIFFGVVFTMRASRLEEKEGRLLKLFGGMLMLALALVMIFSPKTMNNLGSSLLVFGAAFLGAGLVLLVHRKILPAFGIRIGSELKPSRRKHKTAPSTKKPAS
ncbi:MAG TPA: hypothetical protein PKW33_08245 [Anaerolineaceae bacterium]|nr:hypothetical protein [Anaerolineaceae bacterium]HPN51563.1 hypothetical protein [Anaerolineaceae bacterium]